MIFPTEKKKNREEVNAIKWVEMDVNDIVIYHVFALKVLAMF